MQYASMDQMQKELDAENPELDIQFVGINQWGQESGNSGFTDGKDIPWLQDVDADGDFESDVWTSWDITYRDVVILDADSQVVTVFNVTTNDLEVQENYDRLKQILIDTEQCSAGDANRDGVFNSTDLILVFQAAEYEDGIEGNSTWAEGDWNHDGDFDTGDLVTAFQCGEYTSAAAAEPILTSNLNDVRSFVDSTHEGVDDRKDVTVRDEVFQKWSQPTTTPQEASLSIQFKKNQREPKGSGLFD